MEPPMTEARTIQRSAFTLIEILVVVIIMGIAAAVIVPQIGSRGDLKTAAGARVVMADLIYAQNYAISYQTKVYVQFSPSTNSYSLLSAVSPATYLKRPDATNYTTTFGTAGQYGFRDIGLGTVNFGSAKQTLVFDELGTPYSYDNATSSMTALTSPGTIALTADSATLTVSVEQDTGEITAN
jgi:competence protein ComGD